MISARALTWAMQCRPQNSIQLKCVKQGTWLRTRPCRPAGPAAQQYVLTHSHQACQDGRAVAYPTKRPAACHTRARGASTVAHAAPDGSTNAAPAVLVLGGGVVGLTTAVRLLEDMPGLDVTLMAEKFMGDTTSNGAAGVWQPYKLSDTPPELVHRWGEMTFRHLMSLVHSPDAVAAGVFLCYGTSLFSNPEPDPVWKDITPGFSRMTAEELQHYNIAASTADSTSTSDRINSHASASASGQDGSITGPAALSFADGFSYNTVVCEGRLYMRWLLQRVKQLGGRVQQRRVHSVEELAGQGWAAVVDCCGLEAPKLFADQQSYPIRGQVMRVKAPWVKHCLFGHVEDPYYNFYIVPNIETVVLGGTGQYHDWNKEVSLADAERIFAGCCRLMPSLQHAEVVEHWVGLRPGRTSVRLEAETISIGTGASSGDSSSTEGGGAESGGAHEELHVVHNYGHGGSGLTLAWGCAGDAVQLVQQALRHRM